MCGSPSGSTLRHVVTSYHHFRQCRCGMLTRETMRHGETLMPFRQIVGAGRVRRVSPYAISFMPFRQFVHDMALRHIIISGNSYTTWRCSISSFQAIPSRRGNAQNDVTARRNGNAFQAKGHSRHADDRFYGMQMTYL